MAKGRPDWTNSVNITGQDIAEVIERPKYGAAQDAYGSWLLNEGYGATFYSIAGTGVIYGGYIWVTGNADPVYLDMRVTIDGHVFQAFSLRALNLYMIDDKTSYHFYEKYYSPEEDVYSIGIMPGITFEESWVLYIDNRSGSGGDAIVLSTVIYALI